MRRYNCEVYAFLGRGSASPEHREIASDVARRPPFSGLSGLLEHLAYN
jgi:hypothetical protein